VHDVICGAVDVTTYHRGFHGDLNETMFVGAVSDKAKLLVQTTHECLDRAIAAGIIACSLIIFLSLEINFLYLCVCRPSSEPRMRSLCFQLVRSSVCVGMCVASLEDWHSSALTIGTSQKQPASVKRGKIIIIIKDVYIAQVRKGHKCAMSAEISNRLTG